MNCWFFERKSNQIPKCTCNTPPRLRSIYGYIELVFNGVVIADSVETKMIVEAHRPPVMYFPREDVKLEYLTPSYLTAECKWKGKAQFVIVEIAKRRIENVGWYYPEPEPLYTELKNHIAFYPHLLDSCYFDWKRVNYHQDPKSTEWFKGSVRIEDGLLEKVSW
jgi:uncharacterized protein (DUF427 family)